MRWLLLFYLFFFTIKTHACSCSLPVSNEDIDELIKDADVIFIGSTDGILLKDPNYHRNLIIGSYVSFSIQKIFKGGAKFIANVVQSGGNCDREFKQGQKYLILARQSHDGRVKTSGCKVYLFHLDVDVINNFMNRFKTIGHFSLIRHPQLPVLKVDL